MLRKIAAVLCAAAILLTGVSLAENGGGKPPAMPAGNPPAAGQGGPAGPGGSGGQAGPGGTQTVSQGNAASTIDSDTVSDNALYSSVSSDENAVRVTGAVTALLSGCAIEKSGGTENADNCNFYGQNAGLLATDGASVTLSGSKVSTDGSGANGVFSYGEGTGITVTDCAISTAQDNSGGILVTGGGTLSATNLTVVTQGNSSAAIRSDRGGGTMTVEGGTYTANGTGSPAIYSTAAITVRDATLSATASEAVVVEGKNSVTLENCVVTGNMQGTYGQNSGENLQAVMLYQSMSGDASEGRSDFSMTGGSLTTLSGDLFYVTNTDCNIELDGVTLTGAGANLLTVAGNDSSRGWGQQGANGGNCILTASRQTLDGLMTVDAISTLSLSLNDGTAFTGAINTDGQAGEVNVTLDATSTWTLTADSYITSFNGSMDQVVANGYALHIANA